MEVFLYRCEVCNAAKFFDSDYGRSHYVDECNGCRGWAYYEKIVVRMIPGEHYTGMQFVVEEKKDGTSDTRTD